MTKDIIDNIQWNVDYHIGRDEEIFSIYDEYKEMILKIPFPRHVSGIWLSPMKAKITHRLLNSRTGPNGSNDFGFSLFLSLEILKKDMTKKEKKRFEKYLWSNKTELIERAIDNNIFWTIIDIKFNAHQKIIKKLIENNPNFDREEYERDYANLKYEKRNIKNGTELEEWMKENLKSKIWELERGDARIVSAIYYADRIRKNIYDENYIKSILKYRDDATQYYDWETDPLKLLNMDYK